MSRRRTASRVGQHEAGPLSYGRTLWIERDGDMVGIETADVDHVARETSYWAAGTITGAVVDVIAWVAMAAALSNAFPAAGEPH